MGGFSGIFPEAKLMWKLEREVEGRNGASQRTNLLPGLGEIRESASAVDCCLTRVKALPLGACVGNSRDHGKAFIQSRVRPETLKQLAPPYSDSPTRSGQPQQLRSQWLLSSTQGLPLLIQANHNCSFPDNKSVHTVVPVCLCQPHTKKPCTCM